MDAPPPAKTSRLADPLDAFPRLPGCSREAVLAPLPGRCDHAHSEHALRCAEVVDTAGDRPPSVARALEEPEPRQPLFLCEGWRVAIEPAPRHLESEQGEPVLDTIERNEVAVPRGRLAPPKVPPRTEERERIESRDHDLPVGPHRAMDLA